MTQKKNINRRRFMATTSMAMGTALAAPSILGAQGTIQLNMSNWLGPTNHTWINIFTP